MTPYRQHPPASTPSGPTPRWVLWLAYISTQPWGLVTLCAACLAEWMTLGCGLLSIPTGIALARWASETPTRAERAAP